jgi:hypothetical protein
MPSGEDKVTISGIARLLEVVSQMPIQWRGNDIDSRHRGRRVSRTRPRSRPKRVDSDLLAQFSPTGVAICGIYGQLPYPWTKMQPT